MLRNIKKNEARTVFEILARENQPMLITYLRGVIRDQHIIDDLFQETMLIAWRKLKEYDRNKPFGPWLRGIAAKLVLAYFRKSKSDMLIFEGKTLEYLSQQLQYISEKPGDTWDEKIVALKQCIEKLPQDYRQVINLRYFEQNSAAQITSVTKTTLETIKKRLQRARSQLLQCLQHKKVVMEMMT